MRREKHWAGALRALILPLAAVAALLVFFTALNHVQQGNADEGKRQLEDSIRRAAVACYAAEGRYPATLEDLEERYGIQIDRERFTVYYEVYGDNLMPSITILESEKP